MGIWISVGVWDRWVGLLLFVSVYEFCPCLMMGYFGVVVFLGLGMDHVWRAFVRLGVEKVSCCGIKFCCENFGLRIVYHCGIMFEWIFVLGKSVADIAGVFKNVKPSLSSGSNWTPPQNILVYKISPYTIFTPASPPGNVVPIVGFPFANYAPLLHQHHNSPPTLAPSSIITPHPSLPPCTGDPGTVLV